MSLDSSLETDYSDRPQVRVPETYLCIVTWAFASHRLSIAACRMAPEVGFAKVSKLRNQRGRATGQPELAPARWIRAIVA